MATTHGTVDGLTELAATTGDLHPCVVISGGLHGLSGNKVSPTFACKAYSQVTGRYIDQPTHTIDYGAVGAANTDTCWTIMHETMVGNITTFQRVPGTHYLVDVTSGTRPVLPSGAAFLMQVTISGGAITAVTDLRNGDASRNDVDAASLPVGIPHMQVHRRDLEGGVWEYGSGTWYAVPHQVANVMDAAFGAKRDGVTDDTAAIQRALDAAKRVYFPAGVYLIKGGSNNQTDGLALNDGQEIFGDGWGSVLKQDTSSVYAISVNRYNGGTTTVAGNKVNIRLHNLQLLGTVVADAFFDGRTLLNINAASDLVVENVQFTGSRGDAIYIGSGNQVGIERHNQRISIRKCFFNGINKDNGAGIRVVDCDGLDVDDCYFTNLTRSTQPGAFTLQANAIYNVLRSITVRKSQFVNCGGNEGALGINFSTFAFTTVPHNIVFGPNNYINSCNTAFYAAYNPGGAGQTVDNFGLQIINNFADTMVGRPFNFTGMRDVFIKANNFKVSTLGGLLGQCSDFTIENNSFIQLGSSDGFGIEFLTILRLNILNNLFEDCGHGGVLGYGVWAGPTGISSFVDISDNIFVNNAGIMTNAIVVDPGHTSSVITNKCFGNDFAGLLTNFNAYRSDTFGTTGGTFTTGLGPDGFPPGFSQAILDGDAGTPDTGHQGQLHCYMGHQLFGSTFRKYGVQLYFPANNDATSLADVYFRKALSGSNGWSAFKKLTGV